MTQIRLSFTAAMRKFFDLNGKPMSSFAKELTALSYHEKLEFHEMLTKQAGIDCDPPSAPK